MSAKRSNSGTPHARASRWSSNIGRVGILGLAALIAGCKGEAAVQEEVARPVKVAIVTAAPQGRTLTYSGVVRPRIESALGFRVPGKIVARSVNVGDRIEVDQVIARVDETDLKLAENAARATVAAARSRRDVARDNLERANVLLPKAIISQAAHDTRRNELEAAVAALDSAEAQLLQAINAVGYATLKADKAGIVTAVTGEPGQVVGAGQAVITLAEAGETEIAVAVPEQDAARLAIGQPAKITLWAGPRVSISGRIREIAGQSDPASRTYAVRVAVEEPPQTMRLGMTASVALTIDENAALLVVPLAAVTEGEGGGTVAFVVDAASKVVRKTAVSLGGIAESGVQIASGLQAGDMVVTAGVQFLRDGMPIRLPGERAQAATP
ncbi:MAG: efflux RND transporter periplasmic adaptor subunit [Hyphomicrobiaceae bacterium]|nr:MAG: efflux RND transporter periplasmic adaptor subunit [Hyphomicrobiaceae bacterium]